MADSYNIPQSAQSNYLLGLIGAHNAAQAAQGIGQQYNDYMQQQIPKAANDYQQAAAMAAMAKAQPGTAYGYSAPGAMMIDKLFQRNPSPFVGADVNAWNPSNLTQQANAQTLLQDRQAEAGAIAADAVQAANQMKFQAENSPLNSAMLNPNTPGNIMLQNQAVQQGQYGLSKDIYQQGQALPSNLASKFYKQQGNISGTQIPEVLTNPGQLVGISQQDINPLTRVGDTIKEAQPIVAQYQQSAAQAPINSQRLTTVASYLAKLSPSDLSTSSSGWDVFKGNLANVVGGPQSDMINQAKTTYSNTPNIQNARAYVGSIVGIDGDSQIDDASLNKIITADKDGKASISPGALKNYLQQKAQNQDTNLYRNYASQGLIGQLNQSAQQNVNTPGLNNFRSKVEDTALNMQQKAQNISKGFTDDSGMIHYKNSSGQEVTQPVAGVYLGLKQKGLSDAQIQQQLSKFGIPQNASK